MPIAFEITSTKYEGDTTPRKLRVSLTEPSDCAFIETVAEDNALGVFVSLYPLPIGFGVEVQLRRNHGWDWYHRTGKY